MEGSPMRIKLALAGLALAALAACGGSPNGVIQFRGLTPNTAAQKKKDGRHILAYCPNCGLRIDAGADQCPDQRICKMRNIRWESSYACGFCNATGACMACKLLEQEGGNCVDCRGQGYITYLGKTPECPNCKGNAEAKHKGKCPICLGETKCDYCGGSGKLPFETVRARAKKASGESEEEEKKPEPNPEEPKKE